MTLAEVRAGNGLLSRPLYRIGNKKVFEYKGPRTGAIFEQNKKAAGSSLDFLFENAKALYDPAFGVPTSQETMAKEHYQYREDLVKRTLMDFDAVDTLVVVGLLE